MWVSVSTMINVIDIFSLLERPSITSTSCCPAVTSLGRTRMDWLYALCDWQYDIHTRSEAYVRGAAHENQVCCRWQIYICFLIIFIRIERANYKDIMIISNLKKSLISYFV